MKLKPAELIEIYRKSLARYEADGDQERIRIQKALIRRLEEKA